MGGNETERHGYQKMKVLLRGQGQGHNYNTAIGTCIYLIMIKTQPLLLWIGADYSMVLQYECSGERRLRIVCWSTVAVRVMMFILGGSVIGVVVGRLPNFTIAPYLGEMS